MNLVAHRGKIYRVGGMQPRNRPGDPQDVRSVADVARFDPARRQWEALPPLPSPRSSHDVVMLGDRMMVVGGWWLKGKEGTDWPDTGRPGPLRIRSGVDADPPAIQASRPDSRCA